MPTTGRAGPQDPTGGREAPRRGGPIRLTPYLTWLFVVGLVAIGLRSFRDAGVQQIAYSDFKAELRDGVFERVIVGPDWVRGVPKAAERATDRPPVRQATRLPGGDPGLVPAIEKAGVPYEAAAERGVGEAVWIWLLPISIGLLAWGLLARRLSGAMGQAPPGVMAFGKSRARVQVEPNTGVSFEDVAGIDEAVEELREIVDFLRRPERYRRLGGRIPKGVLLLGPPGTGKTLLARATAGEAKVPFFSLSGSEFVEMFVGVGAARVRDLFAQAADRAPCIIFIDELDALGKTRNGGLLGGHDEREQTLNQLLAEMDGFDARAGLILMGATNRPEILDPALMRPGRFDRQVLVDRPDRRGRERILAIHARKVRLAPDVDLKTVAARTPGLAGADLANVVNEAALLAARRGRDAVSREEMEEAVERVVAGLQKKSRRMNDREKEIVAFHEAGHALVAWMLPDADKVSKVSIIPRGLGALGYTLQLPTDDRYLLTRSELRDRMAGLLGGRAAEEEVFGEPSTGAANDLQQVTSIARLMVRDYGMSETVGPVAMGEERGPALLGLRWTESRAHADRTALEIDREIHALVEEAHERAREILRGHRERLDAMAARLLAAEVLEEEEIERILGPKAVRESGRDSNLPFPRHLSV